MTGENIQPRAEMPSVHVANECWNIFMLEIDGAGIVWKFDKGPGDFDDVVKYTIPSHLSKPELLHASVERFSRYRTLLREFVPFSLQKSIPDFSRRDMPKRDVTRVIDTALLERYDLFGQELSNYAQVIDDNIADKTDHDEVVGAAMSLCKIARPAMWDPNVEQGSSRVR